VVRGGHEADTPDQAEHEEHASELAKKSGDVSLHRQRFQVDDAEQKLAIENPELER
jgi:hypothetical protein